jgi:hypothetical protein
MSDATRIASMRKADDEGTCGGLCDELSAAGIGSDREEYSNSTAARPAKRCRWCLLSNAGISRTLTAFLLG